MGDVKSQAVGNYFLNKAKQDNTSLTNLKLQKLVYIAYGFYAHFEKEKLFVDRIEAWQHGSIIPALYHEAKHFGSNPIPKDFKFTFIEEVTNRQTEMGDSIVKVYTPKIPKTSNVNQILDLIWDKYNIYTGWSLRHLTHLKGTPWDKVYNDGNGIFKEIPFDEIKKYYDEFIKKLIKDIDDKKTVD